MTTQEKENQFGARFGRFVVQWRWPILILTLLLGITAASGVRFLGFDQDYRAFFSDENPQLTEFEKVQRTYTKSDTVLFAILPTEGDTVFSKPVIEAVSELTEQSWLLPYTLRVDSMTNFQHTVAEADDLIVANLVEDATSLTPADIEYIRGVAVKEPNLVNQLVSPDGGAAGVLVTFHLPGESIDEMPTVAEAARQLSQQIQQSYPVDIKMTGSVPLNNAFFQSSAQDTTTLVPLMYLIIIVATFLLVRSFTATIGTVIVLIMSVAVGVGMGGWLGILLTAPSAATPTIITTLAVADSVHFLMTMMAAMRSGMEKRAAIVESLRVNVQPIFLTSITTAVGFLSMNFSDAPPFRDLGNMTAIGVMAACLFSLVLLPAFLAIVPVKARASKDRMTASFDWLADFVIRHRKPVLGLSLVASFGLVALIPLNNVNDDMVAYFDKSLEFRQHTDTTLDKLTGIYQLQFSLETGEANGVSDPAFLAKTESFTDWLRQQPEVIHVNSITDTFKRLNKNLHGDDQDWYRLPDERDQASQYLLLYELSLPYGLDLNNQLNIDKSSTRIVATLQDMDSDEMIEITERSEQWLESNTGIQALGVGPAIMFAHISERNIDSMIDGTLIAILIISLMIMVALRSLSIGFISLIPNLLPAGITFGIWGLFVGEVNVAASIVLGMAMGILVDDCVHFLSKYLRGRREHGQSSEEAVRYAFHHVGGAIIVTSVILIAGFALLSLSSFALNKYMAQLTGIAIFVAVIADLLLLPTLLMTLDRKKRGADKTTSTPVAVAQKI